MNKTSVEQKKYRGRFAPSPSGELHFGSLLAAMASYADARSNNGSWLLRIDDIDQDRVIADSDQHIIKTLEHCGFQWDESISYQSHCISDYQTALQDLIQNDLTYPCSCSRKQLRALAVYPGTCRNKIITGSQQKPDIPEHAIRIKLPSAEIKFTDQIQQSYSQHLAREVGDFVILRKDKVFSYQLSVVVDDYMSGISHVIRGYDLLDSTPRQMYLQQQLGYPTPEYAHIPLAVTNDNLKLSKLSHARKVVSDLQTLVLAAQFLGQKTMRHNDYDSREDFWQHLFLQWDINRVPKMEKQKIMY